MHSRTARRSRARAWRIGALVSAAMAAVCAATAATATMASFSDTVEAEVTARVGKVEIDTENLYGTKTLNWTNVRPGTDLTEVIYLYNLSTVPARVTIRADVGPDSIAHDLDFEVIGVDSVPRSGKLGDLFIDRHLPTNTSMVYIALTVKAPTNLPNKWRGQTHEVPIIFEARAQ